MELELHNLEFKILDCQNPEFKILDCQSPETKRGTGADETQDGGDGGSRRYAYVYLKCSL